jgi:hypothetical protein
MTTENTGPEKKWGLFSFLRGENKNSNNCCCNMKIVPKEEPAKCGCCDIKIVPKEKEKNENSCCENKDCC